VLVTILLRLCGFGLRCRVPGRQIKGNANSRHLKKGELASLISMLFVAFLVASSSKIRFGLLHNFERGYHKVEKVMMNMDADHKRYKLNKH
jgi:hypothetical protein